MVATLAVPVPGLPVTPQLALAASANGENEVVSLILPPWEIIEREGFDAEYEHAKRELLTAAGYGDGRKTKAYRRRIAALTR